MNNLIFTVEKIALLKSIYPEMTFVLDTVTDSCQSRARIPALMRSLGKREGVPEDMLWVFENLSVATSVNPSLMTPSLMTVPPLMEVFTEMLGELKGIRELLVRLTEKTCSVPRE